MSGSFGNVGGINADIPLQAGRGVQQNGLATQNPGQFVNTLAGINQLKLFPLQQQQMLQGIERQKLEIAGQKLQQGLTRLNTGVGMMLPLLLDKNGQPTSGVSVKDITRTLADASNPDAGLLTPSEAAGLLQTLPNGGEDPAANRAWLLQHYASMRAAAGAHEQALGMLSRHYAEQNAGGQLLGGTIGGPLTQGQSFAPNTSTTMTMTPAQSAGQVTWKDKNDVTQYGTGAEYAREREAGNVAGPAEVVPYQGSSAPTSAPAQPGGMGGVTGVNGPVTPQNPPRLQTNKPSGGAVTQGALPGTPEYLRQTGETYGAAQDRAGNFASDMFPLFQANEALKTAPTGKGSDAAHNVSSYINTFAPQFIQRALSFITPVMTPEEVSAYDEAKKYLTQGQLGTPGATRSNEGLTTAGAASPSTVISKEAAQVVLRGMIALRRMEQNAVLEFQNTGKPPAAWRNFLSNYATNANPAVYSFDMLQPQQRQKIIDKLKGQEGGKALTKFFDQVYAAQQNGVIGQPSANGQ